MFHASPDVTLEEDLIRRDLTINAMAEDDEGNITDPYDGQRDLEARILRHVSPAFTEDPLRVLRVARFAARYAGLGFSIAPRHWNSCVNWPDPASCKPDAGTLLERDLSRTDGKASSRVY